ncbi:hypothetical protein BRAS3843_1130008 [Bradyrhizobium sp. STM 3843]|uniref:hypothetical protein n=1 Tax=Bradyrhizobium sp. STM 3843 TaxID=551947 RepID=UPI00024066AD|nr:hypothetical protein [Bradyrhizobium sp. STM 3843]CCE04777.1 hypothetical protein BRAS3843_1130008 [Bradyrhizobium sp. STM 3843]
MVLNMANNTSKPTRVPIAAHLPADVYHDFDAWRRTRAKVPTVSTGVGQLMRLALQIEARRKPKAAATTEPATA